MKLLLLTLLLKGYPMALLLMLLHTLLIVCVWRVITLTTLASNLRTFPVYDRKRRTEEIRTTTRQIVWGYIEIVAIAVCELVVLYLIGV